MRRKDSTLMTSTSTFGLTTLLIVLCAAFMPAANVCANDNDSTKYRVRARLSEDGSNMTSKVDYRERTKHDRLNQRLVIRVKHGSPGENLAIKLDGIIIEQLQLDSKGKGRLKLRAKNAADAFATMRAGQTIEVGPLSGELTDHSNNSSKGKASRLKLKAKLTSDSDDDGDDGSGDDDDDDGSGDDDGDDGEEGDSLEATSFYKERLKHGKLDRRFMAKVEHAEPGETFDVFVNDHEVGQMTADADGEARIYLKRYSMPEEFPRLVSGDTVTIGSLTGTLLKHGN